MRYHDLVHRLSINQERFYEDDRTQAVSMPFRVWNARGVASRHTPDSEADYNAYFNELIIGPAKNRRKSVSRRSVEEIDKLEDRALRDANDEQFVMYCSMFLTTESYILV